MTPEQIFHAVGGKLRVNTQTAAELMGYKSRETVLNMIHTGELSARRRGRIWTISCTELSRWESDDDGRVSTTETSAARS